jgi:hypothetical protein
LQAPDSVDVGVDQRDERLGLPLEAGQSLDVGGEFYGMPSDRDIAAEGGVGWTGIIRVRNLNFPLG